MYKRLIQSITFVLLSVMMASCGPSADDVAAKLGSSATIEEADYEAMADYVTSAVDDIHSLITDFDNPDGEAAHELALVDDTYPHFFTFLYALKEAPEGSVGKQVYKERKVMSSVLMLIGEPERRKATMPDRWRDVLGTLRDMKRQAQ